jgi:hypothetical protein
MIYKNNKKYEITTEEIAKITTMVHNRFPITFVYSNSTISDSNQQGKLKKRIGGVLVPFESIVQTNTEGSVIWNYTKVPPMIKGDEVRFYTNTEAGYLFDGMWSLDRKDIDLIYYLLFCSNVVKGSNGCKTGYELLQVDDTIVSARSRNYNREKRILVESQILGTSRLHIEDISRIAKAFSVQNTDNMTEEELRDSLWIAVEAKQQRTHDGYDYFNQLAESEDRQIVLSSLQILKDARLISYNAKTAEWFLLEPETKKRLQKIGSIKANRTQDESLNECVMESEDTQKLVVGMANTLKRPKQD